VADGLGSRGSGQTRSDRERSADNGFIELTLKVCMRAVPLAQDPRPGTVDLLIAQHSRRLQKRGPRRLTGNSNQAMKTVKIRLIRNGTGDKLILCTKRFR